MGGPPGGTIPRGRKPRWLNRQWAITLIEVVLVRSPGPPPDRAEESILAPALRNTDRA
jgi:hypothetical protein